MTNEITVKGYVGLISKARAFEPVTISAQSHISGCISRHDDMRCKVGICIMVTREILKIVIVI